MTSTNLGSFDSLGASPAYFSLLSSTDAHEYQSLRAGFHDGQAKSKKGERLDTFMDQLKQIRHFIERTDDRDTWKRSLVCGIFFLADGFALNIQQLRILLGRCKSSINGSLQQLGCSAEISSQSAHPDLLVKIPPSYRDVNELKKWTIRRTSLASRDLLSGSAFVIPLPVEWTAPTAVYRDPFQMPTWRNLPCPVKCRYKYYEMLCQSAAVQVDAVH
jgi:hypothetical protein